MISLDFPSTARLRQRQPGLGGVSRNQVQPALPSGDVFEPRSVLPSTAMTSRAATRVDAAHAAKPR